MFFVVLGFFILSLLSSITFFEMRTQFCQAPPAVVKEEVVSASSLSVPPLRAEKRELEGLERAFRMACWSVWVKAKEEGCPNADSPSYTWSFLEGYSTVKDLLSCSGSPTFSCSNQKEYGCYVLKQALEKNYFLSEKELTLRFSYDAVISSVSNTDPCSAVGIFY